ncbi:MAG: indolepyruvate ferredoxin oxidoreductase subunit alpha [Coriobacteriia bacterium]
MSRTLTSGNEAVARGAWEAGVAVGVGYPGTPSTEVLENLVRYEGVRCEWAPNEKVAAEVAAGVSMAGKRALVTMKHVGLNVAADPLYTQAYAGVRGGLVYLVADDPGMHSSQNEQDTRNHAAAAKVPLLEPSDSDEARRFTRVAFEISEKHDIPVIVRTTTRISHGKSLTAAEDPETLVTRSYVKEPDKWVMIPGHARARRRLLDGRLAGLAAYANDCDLNRMELRDPSLGIVCSGVVYQYVREALPEASVLKLGIPYPFPSDLVLGFNSRVERVAVIEELDPYLTSRVKALGVELVEHGLPSIGELSPRMIAEAFGETPLDQREAFNDLPPRPPLLCPGCPHRGVFWALDRMKAVVTGDIGCYTLGALPPLQAMDSCICMGASVGMAHGMEIAAGTDRPLVAVIGDSTFAHSGITGLLHMVYNGGHGTVVVLDNRTTAMTGHQGNPVSGRTIAGDPAPELDLEALGVALGAATVRVVDPQDLEATVAVLREETAAEHVSVVVAKAPCALLIGPTELRYAVDDELCSKCGACVRLGCPAISKEPSGIASIDVSVCVGCGQCVQVCRYDAIAETGPACDIGGGAS